MRKTRRVVCLTAIVFTAFVLSAGIASRSLGGSEGMAPNHEALAEKLVTQCAGIKENNAVLISGGVRNLDLLENIAVHVRRQGGLPLVTVESDRMTKRMYDDVPAKYDSQTPSLGLKMADLFDVMISVDSAEEDGLLAHADPQRMAARAKAGAPIGEVMNKRGVRRVNLGNAMYPTAFLARRFGLSQEELARVFWAGVNVDYAKLEATGGAVKAALSSGKEIRITNPNGTDLRARIEGRPVFVSDGVISADEVAKGGAATETWLPAGEVYLAAVPGTAEGKVVVDRQFYQGKEIQGLTLTFKDGRLDGMTAKSGLEPLKAFYDASGAGKDVFGVIDLGINPNVRLIPGSKMQAWMPAGMVTVGFGNNTFAGGDNNAPFGLFSFLPGSTVTVDGRTIVESGTLKM